MNISKFFVTTAAAVSVVGAIGFAYAQTTTDPRTTSGTADQNRMPNQSVPADRSITPNRTPGSSSGAINDGSTGAMNQGATTTTRSGSINDGSTGAMGQGSTGATSSERLPRADRN